jgi:hypothetical protein
MPKFLSDEWFEKVAELNEAAGEIRIDKGMRNIVVNLRVASEEGEVLMCMNRGLMQKGHADRADVDMSMPADYAHAILVQGEWSAGMKGWVKRKIKLKGNMRKLMPLQTHTPTPDQVELREKIAAITD